MLIDIIAAAFFAVALWQFFVSFRGMLVDLVARVNADPIVDSDIVGAVGGSVAMRWRLTDDEIAEAESFSAARALMLSLSMPARSRGTPSIVMLDGFDIVPRSPVIVPPPLPAPVDCTTIRA